MQNSELESIKHLENQFLGMKLILKINRGLRIIGLGSKNISELDNKLKDMELQLHEIKNLPKEFNKIFSKRGWITYDSIDMKLVKKCLEVYHSSGIDIAEKLLLDHYSYNNIQNDFIRLKALPEFLIRFKFIEYALNDYKDDKYYSVIPLLLMTIDGTVNDIIGKGFHSENSTLDVWDSITNIDNGIYTIKDIFKSGRNKTRDDIIDLPYRNGILHGMDLGYDNYTVAAKCWHFLFVIRDWGLAKHSEDIRKRKFEEDKNPPTFKQLFAKINETERVKKAQKEWKKRILDNDYVTKINETKIIDESLPEFIVLEFLELWKKKNYGDMAKRYWSQFFHELKPNIIEVKNQFKDLQIVDWEFTHITDEASGITVINLKVRLDKNIMKDYTIRLVYEGTDGYARSRNLNDGQWRIVFVQEKR